MIKTQIAENKRNLIDSKWKNKIGSVKTKGYTDMIKNFTMIPQQKLQDKMGIFVLKIIDYYFDPYNK